MKFFRTKYVYTYEDLWDAYLAGVKQKRSALKNPAWFTLLGAQFNKWYKSRFKN